MGLFGIMLESAKDMDVGFEETRNVWRKKDNNGRLGRPSIRSNLLE
jgi:hypothetical protein